MSQHLVCRVKVFNDPQHPRLEFTWSRGSACFEPIELEDDEVRDFQSNAQAAREILLRLVVEHAPPADERDAEAIRDACKELAGVGWNLFNLLLPKNGPRAEVRGWLEDLTRRNRVDSLEIVCDGEPWFAPWNLIYDEDPDDGRFDAADAGLGPFEPFWGIRYNLASGLPVNPLRSSPLPEAPDVLLVIDPIVEATLKDHADGEKVSQHDRLVEFIESARASGVRIREVVSKEGLKRPFVDSKEALKRAFRVGRPDVIYWLCHANPNMLQLGADEITVRDLNDLLRPVDTGPTTNGLVILNACRTAQPGGVGSFLKSFHKHNYCGIIATEERTLDTFASPFGLDLLLGFLRDKEPIGRLLRALRRQNVPLGLLYGTYCPVHLEIQKPEVDVPAPAPLAAVSLSSTQKAIELGSDALAGDAAEALERVMNLARTAEPLCGASAS